MADMITPDAIQLIMANPTAEPSSDLPQIVVQVTDLKLTGKKYMFMASDGKLKVRSILQSSLGDKVVSGDIQNLGLIRILEYTLNDIPAKNEKYLIVMNCESVAPALETEYKVEAKTEDTVMLEAQQEEGVKSEVKSQVTGILLKPKQEMVVKSAAQIVNEQKLNSAPTARMAMSRRVLPLVSLNPYQSNWCIEVRVTAKGNLRTYRNARGDGCVFNVELTDKDGTQIQATMFNGAANKFFDKFQLGKVYYISKGYIKVANKQFKTVKNEYEMTLNENSEVEEAVNEVAYIPETIFNFVKIDELGPYVNGRELVDVIGVVKSVSPTVSIKRKSNDETVSKRDITIADDTKKTVRVTLWSELATDVGQTLLDMAEQSPVVAIKSLKVGDYDGVSLSAIGKSVVVVDPKTPEAEKLKSWFNSEGKETDLAPVGAGLSPSAQSGGRSMYDDRVSLAHITSNPLLGEPKKPAFFSIKVFISSIKPDQMMSYRACKKCNKKVTDSIEGYWCPGCEMNVEESSLRYAMQVRVQDASGEAYLSVFNDQAVKIIGCTADELNDLKSEGGDGYEKKLKEAAWACYLCRVAVTTNEYNNETRQRITIRSLAPIACETESKFLVEEISRMKLSN